MEYRPLDVTLFSADGIKDVNIFGKMDVYAVVSILGYPRRTKKKIEVDMNCGTSPRWNKKVQLTIDESSLSNPNLFLHIKLKADKSIGDKHIGEVSIPLQELFADDNDIGGGENVVEYQVETSSGKPKGTLKFSYKFGEKYFCDHKDTCDHNDLIETKKDGKGHKEAKACMLAMGYPSHHPGNLGSPRHRPCLAHCMHGSARYQQLPHGQYYPMYLPPQGYGAYPPPNVYAPNGYRHPPPPEYTYQQSV